MKIILKDSIELGEKQLSEKEMINSLKILLSTLHPCIKDIAKNIDLCSYVSLSQSLCTSLMASTIQYLKESERIDFMTNFCANTIKAAKMLENNKEVLDAKKHNQ